MITKQIATGAILCGLAFTPPQQAVADGGDFALGVAAGVIGSAVVRDIKKKNQAKATTTKSSSGSGISSAQREQNRQIQTALNYFAFPVGAPDGVLGRQSRSGISDYQAFLGYPVTGQLTEYERDFLLDAYYRAQSGGVATQQAVLADPLGARGLLLSYRDGAGQGSIATSASVPAAPSDGAMPSFLTQADGQLSLRAWCAQVGGDGAVTMAAAAGDANMVLSEQFCMVRDAAIANSAALMESVPGYAPAQIAAQCRDFGPVLQDYVTALGEAPQAEVLERVSGWTLASGVAPDMLAGTAAVCLGSGYSEDDMTVAIGSALVLTALGQTGYAELAGHHLSQGFGVPRRPDLALDWYDAALSAPTPVFFTGGDGRLQAIRKAADAVGGRAGTGQVPTFATGGNTATKASAAP